MNKNRVSLVAFAFAIVSLLGVASARAQVVGPDGYIFTTRVVSGLTQSCVQPAPSGLFVGVGPEARALPATLSRWFSRRSPVRS